MGCGKTIGKTSKRCSSCHNIYRHYGADSPPKRYCKTCGIEMKPPIQAVAVYCSRACTYASPDVIAKLKAPRNSVTKNCPHCRNDFAVPVSNKDRYKYCSLGCSRAARGVDGKCKRCGGKFRYGLSRKGKPTNVRHYCSEACRRPPVLVTCRECGTDFRSVPSAAGKRRFCSPRCYIVHQGETSIEERIRLLLEELNVKHEAQASVGPWVVDFLVGENIVVEADGDYWHTLRPDVDARKDRDLSSRGYCVYRFTETLINQESFRDVMLQMLKLEQIDQSSAATHSA